MYIYGNKEHIVRCQKNSNYVVITLDIFPFLEISFLVINTYLWYLIDSCKYSRTCKWWYRNSIDVNVNAVVHVSGGTEIV